MDPFWTSSTSSSSNHNLPHSYYNVFEPMSQQFPLSRDTFSTSSLDSSGVKTEPEHDVFCWPTTAPGGGSHLAAPFQPFAPSAHLAEMSQGVSLSHTNEQAIPQVLGAAKIGKSKGFEWMTVKKGARGGGPTKKQTNFTAHQCLELEKEFLTQKYVKSEQKTAIAHRLGITENQVKTWFQNRRQKEKKTRKESGESQRIGMSSSPE